MIPSANLAHEPAAQAFADFVQIVQRLRKECPWDKEQTHDSIKHLLIEEAYETVEAIDNNDLNELKKELGDLLLHVVFHAVIAQETDTFSLQEVIVTESQKLIRRHPHVYGDVTVQDTASVLSNWEKIKQTENEGKIKGVLDGVPKQLPALLQAERIQDKASGVGFDFPDAEGAFEKVLEEIEEFKVATGAEAEKEFGDILFALVNYARFKKISPENALRNTNQKFMSRFAYIEAELRKMDKTPSEASLEEMDRLWEEAKIVMR
jgi:MazG family protein